MEIEKIEATKFFKYLNRHRLIDTLELRNLKIRRDFSLMRKQMDAHDAFFLLMEKYGLSFETIRTILFRRSKRKA